MADPVVAPELYINRELSWLAFNQRVLAQALSEHTPLLEQAKFSAIFSNNLDEFFMVRVASLKSQVEADVQKLSDDGLTPSQQLALVRKELAPLLHQQQAHYRHYLKHQLAEAGVHLLDYRLLNKKQKAWVNDYFQRAIFPVLTPLAVDPAHPFPFISNLSLNIAALIRDPDSGVQQFARVKVPQKNLPRFVELPAELSTTEPQPVFTAVPLEQVVAFNLQLLFPGMEVEGHYFFRVTRDADLELRDLEADDLMEALQQGLRKRRMGGEVVRLEVADEMPDAVVELLLEGTGVDPEDLYRIGGPLGLDDLMSLLSIPLPALKDAPHRGRTALSLARAQKSLLEDGSIKAEEFTSIFSVLRRGDVLLHHPFDLFSTSVEEFINQAADDPSVLAIKMTLYRVSKDSPIIAALIRASENGKQVMVLVELKARFDEDNNIQWARQLERSGVHVVYGVIGLKTHTKITLVVRKEKDLLRSYCHIGTGNYNHRTARIYEDIGILTADPEIGADVADLFNHLTGYGREIRYNKLLVAPDQLRPGLEALIDNEIASGQGRMIFKMNSLVDVRMTEKLYGASQAGVDIDLIIRGQCSLKPGIPGLSDRIRVRSIIGRYLEHSRIYHFANGVGPGEPATYIGSADLMSRNLNRRVEALVRLDDPRTQQRVREILNVVLDDDRLAWTLTGDGVWTKRRGPAAIDTHARLQQLARGRANG